jgi:uncharacterized protein YyaL (SSP411 family)
MIGKSLQINRLVNEKSPYLLQHARNPVDWFPWDDEAFEKAKQENKPIFLSIGYSSCHWCHVMAEESFSDQEVADLMNKTFVNIKVDREERPDIDQLYMTVCQMMTGHGGWPLTIIMTPDKKPFYAGTYFPKESRFGRIGLLDLIPRIEWAWEEKHDDIINSADIIIDTVKDTFNEPPGKEILNDSDLKNTFKHLKERFDEQNGGFGIAPKFPMAHNLMFLLRYWKRHGDKKALHMTEKTLQSMRDGGIFDQVGFGFHRYSTDNQWLVPHFEKMLYDQALMSLTYLEAYQATQKLEYRQTVEEIFEYVLNELKEPSGVFFSSQDADSDGEEGKYYLWTLKEFRDALKDEDARILQRIFDIQEEGNYKDEATGRPSGKNILHLAKSIHQLSRELNIPQPDLEEIIESARRKLKEYRSKRTPLRKDNKILTDWNSLMIAALARGGAVLGNLKYITAAEDAAINILQTMRKEPGLLFHSYRDSSSGIKANLDDYAFLSFGLLELYEATFGVRYLKLAIELTREMVDLFEDEESNTLYFSSKYNSDLPIKAKEIYDGAIPSGNSIAVYNLLRLGLITGDVFFDKCAYDLIKAVSTRIRQLPTAHTMLLACVDFMIGPTYKAAIVGETESAETHGLVQPIREKHLPNVVTVLKPTEEADPEIIQIAPYLKDLKVLEGNASAYICSEESCVTETEDAVILINTLNPREIK